MWFDRIESWQKSGLTQADFCRQHHLKPASFYNWLSKYRQSTDPELHQIDKLPEFIPVSMASIPAEFTLTVGEVSLRFSSQLPPAALILWIRALRNAEC